MSNNLEKKFLLELTKRNQKRKSNWIIKTIIFCKKNKFIRYFFIKSKFIRPKYILGLIVLFSVLGYQYNIIRNPIDSLVTKLIYQPHPPTIESPWSWSNSNQIHPVIANMNPEVETSIKSVADYIAQNEPDPYLRIKAIHDYVINRVDYDLDVLTTGLRPPQDPQTVFKTHKAVCEGYAKLFQALSRAMGEKTTYITGRVRQEIAPDDLIPFYLKIGKSKYDWTLHAWNAVKIAGSWHLVDTTWDDNRDNKYSSDYLMLPPEAMITSHFPDLSDWQLLTKAKNHKQFENSPILKPQFFAQNLSLVSPQKYTTKVDKSALIHIKIPNNYQKNIFAFFSPIAKEKIFNWELFKQDRGSSVNRTNRDNCQEQNRLQNEITISCNFPKSGKYKVFIFSQEKMITALGQLQFNVH